MSPAAIRTGCLVAVAMAVFHSAPGLAEEVFGIDLDQLLALNADWSQAHEAAPMGVPRDFKWAARPYLEAGNEPGDFAAITGWGQVFWSKATAGHPGPVFIRNFQTYLCHGTERSWQRIQLGKIEGAEFRGDFKNNSARPPARFNTEGGVSTVLFDAGNVFHFWHAKRVKLPDKPVCGVVVLLEAKVSDPAADGARQQGGYMIGLGADFWVDMTSPWDGFKSNKGVGLGRLKYVRNRWAWYGMSTASDFDLRRLYASGLLRTFGQPQ